MCRCSTKSYKTVVQVDLKSQNTYANLSTDILAQRKKELDRRRKKDDVAISISHNQLTLWRLVWNLFPSHLH